jgi:hypothetical protein
MPPVEKLGRYETCPGCGIKWPRAQCVERRRQHAIMRQVYPGCSDAEARNRLRCVAWAEGRA